MTQLHSAMLRAASLLVPGTQRTEWLAEWRAELGYVTHARTGFCLGAFRDAFWLRHNNDAPNAPGVFEVQSPVRCLLLLAALAAVSLYLGRDSFLPLPYPDAGRLAMISADRQYETQKPTVPLARYRLLAAFAGGRFTGVAFYCPTLVRVRTARLTSADLSVAISSPNLFQLLEIPIAVGARGSLVLSDAAWRKYFDADPEIVGRTLDVGGQQAVVAAVIPADSWRLPGRADAWLLEDQRHLDQLPAETAGFVLGRERGLAEQHGAFFLASERFEVSSLSKSRLLLLYLFPMSLSLIFLSVTTSLALGEYPANRETRLRRWIFFGVKIALILPIVICGVSLITVNLQAHGLIAASLLGFRWALIDQRRRCPVCLRLLSNPTRIGGPSQTFLEWYGTELICAQGHGLLYIPEIPSSCYSVQRWQYLDPSWSSLFL
uniref:MacB-like periplasmic core domain-containing protein n=1 Tax=Solibacter usitatus (strain Ellin6076) TaxID=234267 RepID=Q01UT7_SOLUE